jgi:hypothetical protein
MKTSVKPLLLAGLLAAASLAAQAHPGSGPGAETQGRHAERMQEHLQRRAAELKTQLQLSPEQERAWTDYLAALKPVGAPARPDPAELARLNTPERLDRLRELRRQRDAEFERRAAATRNFYASLNAAQQKVFDEGTARLHSPRHGAGWR